MSIEVTNLSKAMVLKAFRLDCFFLKKGEIVGFLGSKWCWKICFDENIDHLSSEADEGVALVNDKMSFQTQRSTKIIGYLPEAQSVVFGFVC